MTTLQQQVLHHLSVTTLQRKPFERFTISQCFDDDFYQEMIAHMPDLSQYHELKHPHCLQADGSYARRELILTPETLSQLPEPQQSIWRQCYEVLCSEEVKRFFFERFRKSLTKRFGTLDNLPIHPQVSLLRDLSGYRIGVHSDTRQKLFTMQCYLPDDDSQQHLGTRFHKRDILKRFHLIEKLPYLPNSGYAFSVTHNSWHSVELMGTFEKPRNSIMLNYYKSEPIPEKIRFVKMLPTLAKKITSKK